MFAKTATVIWITRKIIVFTKKTQNLLHFQELYLKCHFQNFDFYTFEFYTFKNHTFESVRVDRFDGGGKSENAS